MESSLWQISMVILAGLFSFVFSGMEAGVAALSRLRILEQQRAGRPSARVLQKFLDHPENFLWTILIGNTLATFTLFGLVISGLYGASYRHPALFFAVFAVVAFLFYVVCDLLPKLIFRQFPNRLSLLLAIPFRFLHLALSPLVRLAEGISAGLIRITGRAGTALKVFGSRNELRWMMQEAGQSLTSEERSMIGRVLGLRELQIGSIATPLANVVMVSATTPLSEVTRLSQECGRTRVPVWRPDGRDRRIAGVLSLRTFLYDPRYDGNDTAEQHMIPPLYLRQEMRVETALRRLQRSGQRIAIVVGPDQREIGIVTLQDVLKVIFGEVSL